MIKKPITVNLSTGLEARPVAQLVQVASQLDVYKRQVLACAAPDLKQEAL